MVFRIRWLFGMWRWVRQCRIHQASGIDLHSHPLLTNFLTRLGNKLHIAIIVKQRNHISGTLHIWLSLRLFLSERVNRRLRLEKVHTVTLIHSYQRYYSIYQSTYYYFRRTLMSSRRFRCNGGISRWTRVSPRSIRRRREIFRFVIFFYILLYMLRISDNFQSFWRIGGIAIFFLQNYHFREIVIDLYKYNTKFQHLAVFNQSNEGFMSTYTTYHFLYGNIYQSAF